MFASLGTYHPFQGEKHLQRMAELGKFCLRCASLISLLLAHRNTSRPQLYQMLLHDGHLTQACKQNIRSQHCPDLQRRSDRASEMGQWPDRLKPLSPRNSELWKSRDRSQNLNLAAQLSSALPCSGVAHSLCGGKVCISVAPTNSISQTLLNNHRKGPISPLGGCRGQGLSLKSEAQFNEP